ncbi:MAG: DUF1963 domain-containing protein [Synergistaceae bacterium]|jgi:uncharacterized protein YwqG|nr:DUF1963 domain-containing protein [Synergistaceae bacterium]
MDLLKRLVKGGFEKQAKILEKYALDSIWITTEPRDEAKFKLGESKIGGNPHLPADFQWPEFYSKSLGFLAQLNLEHVSPYDAQGLLPASGMLYFFHEGGIEAWGFDPKDKGAFQVVYYLGDISELKVTPNPAGDEDNLVFAPCGLTFKKTKSYPLGEYLETLNERMSFEGKKSDEFDDIVYEYEDSKGPNHKLFGYPDLIQGEIFLESQLVSNRLYCGDESGYHDPRAKELKKGVKDWMLLFQLDTDDNANMMWGDMGTVYYTIRKEDLKDRKFDAAWSVFQCC